MSTTTPTPKDSPLMREWENYTSTEEYQNSFRWAAHEEHRQGSMWAAFMAGFLAVNPDGAKSDSANAKLSQLRPLAEAGAVPEGCLRFYTYKKDGEWTTATKYRAMQDTHYIDTRLPESEPMSTKPISPPTPNEAISLRDWLAGQALEGMLSNPESISNKTSVAIHAYGFADAMLAAREVKP